MTASPSVRPVPQEWTQTADPGVPLIDIDRNFTLTTSVTDMVQVAVGGVRKTWFNEWMALRGTSPYSWGDALVRARRENSDGITTGYAYELYDGRTGAASSIMWGVRWTDGAMVQADSVVGAVFTLTAAQTTGDIPTDLPVGTLIVQKQA